MMFNERYRLHPISAIINFVKGLKDLLFPTIIIFISNGFQFSFSLNPTDERFWEGVPTVILLIGLFIVLMAGIIKWKSFIYWFEDNELRVEYGVFVKKKRYIPFDRIQSLNYQEGIFHRVFGLVQVRVETAGNADGKAEAELTAVTKQAAEQIETEMHRARKPVIEREDLFTLRQGKVIHKMATKNILLHATTSGAIGVVLSGVVALVSQFSELIPYEKIFDELAAFVKISLLLVGITIFLLLLLAWIISVCVTALNYYDFTVNKESDRLIITRGLLEKKKVTIMLNRVQAIRIVENPFRQLFGYATVVIESAGGSTGEKDRRITLFPFIKKGEEIEPLQALFPEYDFSLHLTMAPKRARSFFYRLNLLWLVPLTGVVSYYFYPYGLFSLILIVLFILLGFWQHRTTGYMIKHKQLTMRYRKFSRVTVYMQKHRIQSLSCTQSFFQKRKQLASVKATVMSGLAGTTSTVYSVDETYADEVMEWYENRG